MIVCHPSVDKEGLGIKKDIFLDILIFKNKLYLYIPVLTLLNDSCQSLLGIMIVWTVEHE